MILHFRPTLSLQERDGTFVEERQCAEHPRLVQRCIGRDGDGGFVLASYYVDDLRFESLAAALGELRANRSPGDLVAVPPWQPNEGANEEVRRDIAS